LIATRRQGIQDVTRRQGCASRRGRVAVADPGARVILFSLAPPGMGCWFCRQSARPPLRWPGIRGPVAEIAQPRCCLRCWACWSCS